MSEAVEVRPSQDDMERDAATLEAMRESDPTAYASVILSLKKNFHSQTGFSQNGWTEDDVAELFAAIGENY